MTKSQSRISMESLFSKLAADGLTARSPGEKAVERAQQIMYQAWEEGNPQRCVTLAKKALEISPDCADAYCLLADHVAANTEQALDLYRKGVEAGERAIGKSKFQEYRGHFWGILETRPYMRARVGMAQCLWELGRREEALDHYRQMLELNPNDNQGIRSVLLACLLDMNLDDEASKLLKAYDDDATAHWVYTRALVAYRSKGDSAEARKLLSCAIKCNPHVPAYLLGAKRIPRNLPDRIGFGDASEAVAYAGDYVNAWRQSYGALGWLKDFTARRGKHR